MLEKPIYEEVVAKSLDLKIFQVKVVLDLIGEGATVPFISRYRKEKTGNLDENEIRQIIELQKKEENIYNAKNTAINGITELGKMTEELMQNILKASSLKEVEEIYKPYKSKKKTKAMIAIEKGFQVVADNIKKNILEIPEDLLKDYSKEEIIEGSQEIIGAEISANSELRHFLIDELKKYGVISSSKKSDKMLEKLNEKDKEQVSKFDIYFDFSLSLSRIKPYQILALNRGENLGILNVKIEKDEMIFEKLFKKYLYNLQNPPIPNPFPQEEKGNSLSFSLGGKDAGKADRGKDIISELSTSFKIGYEALFSSVENELRSDLNELGEDDSIKVFQTNLKSLLMTKPEYGKNILAIDPGFRVGCKVCVLDKIGNPVLFDKIFINSIPHPNPLLKGEGTNKTSDKIIEIIKKFQIEVIVIGNGTASNETVEFLKSVLNSPLLGGEGLGVRLQDNIYIVNESGASVYSVSKIAEEEFKDLDSLDRGTVSIGRRFIDPLSELVKVPVGSIGVGMYQHDISEKKLEEKLGFVVEDSVNEVGINVNSASVYLLNHISGIDKRQAKKIFQNRPYSSRGALKKVLGDKAYEQAIGFLRVPESKEILDNTDIHPEQYELARYIKEKSLLSPALSPPREKGSVYRLRNERNLSRCNRGNSKIYNKFFGKCRKRKKNKFYSYKS